MKFAVSLCCLALLVSIAAADVGRFIPKAFYTMDADGHKSDIHPISPDTSNYLSRARRGIVLQSTTTNASNDGPVKFTTLESTYPGKDKEVRVDGVPVKGHVVTTSGYIDKTGKVVYKTEEGYLK